MWCILVIFGLLNSSVHGLWDRDVICPQLCTCRLEHVTEISINNFMQPDKQPDIIPIQEEFLVTNNDVFYEDDFIKYDENSFMRSATCIVQTETVTKDLIDELPNEIESILLIQAVDSGNKTIKFSYFKQFPNLQLLQLHSAQEIKQNPHNHSHFICEIDTPLENIKYLNLERIYLKNMKQRYEILMNEISDNEVIFEYVQKREDGGHPLTFVQRGPTVQVVPYKTYIENQEDQKGPLFKGFDNLVLLRIYDCELNNINWEMFEGLENLNYLILEKNKLRFVPDFAFYGTPNLKSLSLAWNELLNIQITDLAGLLELEYLDLSHNNFSQLSELSLPPFPKLKLANFANNPITVVFPNTFEVMNTTNSLIVGGLEQPLTLQVNSFAGLKLLESLTLLQCSIPLLKQEIFIGMPTLKSLIMSGNIPEIQYDAFLEVINLDRLILSKCNISKLSIDAFIGLKKLRLLDLSKNALSLLPPSVFDSLTGLRELYLNENKFRFLPDDIFSKINPRLIRLNDNAWHCSCDMSEWKPMIVNRIKQKSMKACDSVLDKGVGCTYEDRVFYKFVYENRVAPKCATPTKYLNWSVFHVMRKQFKCSKFRPKLKKRNKMVEKALIEMKGSDVEKMQESNESKMASKIQTSDESKTSSSMSSTEYYPTDSITTDLIKDISTNTKVPWKKSKLEKLNRKLARHSKLKKTLKASKQRLDNNISIVPQSSNI